MKLRRSTRPCWRLAALLMIAPLIALALFRAHARPDSVDDQKLFAYFGWRIAGGATEYVDVWDNKPPGIYWFNALGFALGGGDAYAGVVILSAAVLVVTFAALCAVGRKLYSPGTATLLAIFAAPFLLNPYYEGGTNRTEILLVLFELTALALYLHGTQRHQPAWLLAAGAACGAAFLCKQVGLAAWGAMGLHTLLLAITGHIRWRGAVARGLTLIAGVLLAIGAAAAVLAARGALDAAWVAVVTFNRAYFAVQESRVGLSLANQLALWDHMQMRLVAPLLLAAAAIITGTVATLTRQRRALPRTGIPLVIPLLIIWLLAACYGAAVSPHRFRHYVLPTLPPLLLLAGYVVHVVKTRAPLARRLRRRPLAALMIVAVLATAIRPAQQVYSEAVLVWRQRDAHWIAGQWLPAMAPTPSERLAAIVRRHTSPGDRIQAWGFWPGVYLAARLPNATRFATTEKLGQVGREADWIADEFHATLLNHPPRVLLIPQRDLAYLLPASPPPKPNPLTPLLREHYTDLAALYEVHIFIRN